jgi:hypothetical protein
MLSHDTKDDVSGWVVKSLDIDVYNLTGDPFYLTRECHVRPACAWPAVHSGGATSAFLRQAERSFRLGRPWCAARLGRAARL